MTDPRGTTPDESTGTRDGATEPSTTPESETALRPDDEQAPHEGAADGGVDDGAPDADDEAADADGDEVEVEETAAALGSAAGATSRERGADQARLGRLGRRGAAPASAAAPTPSELAVRVGDRASSAFVLITIGAFVLIMLNAAILGNGGLLNPVPTPTPRPSPTASPPASPSAAPSGSPSITVSPSPS